LVDGDFRAQKRRREKKAAQLLAVRAQKLAAQMAQKKHESIVGVEKVAQQLQLAAPLAKYSGRGSRPGLARGRNGLSRCGRPLPLRAPPRGYGA